MVLMDKILMICQFLLLLNQNQVFLSTGDGSGRLENSLLKYYDGTNVLKNITLFKAAHHGSIASGENSEEFFMETTLR